MFAKEREGLQMEQRFKKYYVYYRVHFEKRNATSNSGGGIYKEMSAVITVENSYLPADDPGFNRMKNVLLSDMPSDFKPSDITIVSFSNMMV